VLTRPAVRKAFRLTQRECRLLTGWDKLNTKEKLAVAANVLIVIEVAINFSGDC